MFAYCNNNPVNYADESGLLARQAIINGLINGTTRAISTLIISGSIEEAGFEFIIGFADGVVSSYFAWFEVAVAVYDAIMIAADYKRSGASDAEALSAALITLVGSVSLGRTGDELTDHFVDATFGFGQTLSFDGSLELWRDNIEQNQIVYTPHKTQSPSTIKNLGRNGGIGGTAILTYSILAA